MSPITSPISNQCWKKFFILFSPRYIFFSLVPNNSPQRCVQERVYHTIPSTRNVVFSPSQGRDNDDSSYASSTSEESDDDEDPLVDGHVGLFWGDAGIETEEFRPSGFFSADGTWYDEDNFQPSESMYNGVEPSAESELQKVLRQVPLSKTTKNVLPPTFVQF